GSPITNNLNPFLSPSPPLPPHSFSETLSMSDAVSMHKTSSYTSNSEPLVLSDTVAITKTGTVHATVSSPPAGLAAKAISTSQINLSWTIPSSDGSSPITGYKIYRSSSAGLGSGNEGYLRTVGNVTSYIDTGLAHGVTYFYKISAINSVGTSPQSNEASATTLTISSALQHLQAIAGIGI